MRAIYKTIAFLLFATVIAACSQKSGQLSVTPYPQSVVTTGGELVLPDTLTFTAQMSEADLADLIGYLPAYPLNLSLAEDGLLNISVMPAAEKNAEGYSLVVTDKGIALDAPTSAGVFYGLQTLAQLARGKNTIPQVKIEDYPRFAYRGMHLDVSRHFFGKEFIKKQLDAIASYKMNRFHWHLTDGTGWRLEIPKYPQLTEVAAWRPQALWKDWWNGDRRYCTADTPGAYGGYFTADDVREVLEYARLRHITVIPEIEMPGHSEEVLAVYPSLACSGKPYTSAEVCIGNEDVFVFFENVLDVVMELFPSEYIHIGGDEADMRHWAACPKCQKRMKDEGFTEVSQLQSYLITRIEKYLNDHGRQIIGWDEILEGGLAPNATVMSWRGIEGGMAAARSGHHAIMTPGDFCYLDHYQAPPQSQPEAIGGFLPVAKVYSYDPAPEAWGDSVSDYILGVQGNLWSEYIPNDKQMEYMIYPRIVAIAEVGWTKPENKLWDGFKVRMNDEIAHLQQLGYNPYTLCTFPTATQRVNLEKQCMEVSLEAERYPAEIRYTTDGSEPTAKSTLYTKPVAVRDTLPVRARLFTQEGEAIGEAVNIVSLYHKGIGKKAVYTAEGSYYIHDERYKAGGDTALVDGLTGGSTYTDGRWQGFCPRDLDVTIDLGEVTDVRRVTANFMQDIGPWIFFPSKVVVDFSTDGENFTTLCSDSCDVAIDAPGCLLKEFGWWGNVQQARYIRFHAFQSEKKAFIFTDEIIIL